MKKATVGVVTMVVKWTGGVLGLKGEKIGVLEKRWGLERGWVLQRRWVLGVRGTKTRL